MKKILAAALVMGLFSAVNVYAGSTELKVVVPSSVTQGETFDVDIDVVSNTGFTSFDGLIEYDPTVVRLTGPGESAADRLKYPVGEYENFFLTNSFISSMVTQVPPESDSFYDGRANGKDTAAAIGAVKLANYVDSADSNNKLLRVEGTGTLCTLRFEAIGSGKTAIEVKNTLFSTVNPSDRWHSDASSSIEVAASENKTEATTAAASGRSGGGGGGSSSSKVSSEKTTETTTAAAEEETQAVQTVEEETIEPTTAQAPAAPAFSDLSGVSWAVPYINDLSAKGIVNGYSDGTFKPNANVKRCDFVVMLAKALDLPDGTDNFSDVASGAYYAKAVSAAKAAKIVNGNTDGTFKPDSLITRQDMMVIAKGALEYAGLTVNTDESVLNGFTDSAQISAYAKPGASAMVNAGIVNGSNGKIDPKGNTTRAQAAVIISKICEQISK
ncbi:MAG: S-layer homology domain-containing protein [Firmicutes bacterium]|nr:S-layer homology domain-containing protein [Bacillota bacterium]